MKIYPVILAASLLFGCSPAFNNLQNIGKESDPSRFYTLNAEAQADKSQRPLPQLMLGVGPIVVADYLDRSQIVVRESDTRLELAEFDRWAGNPAKEIQRVLGANLATLLGTEQVAHYPWRSGINPDMTVEATIERFEYSHDGKVRLVAGWQVLADNGRRIVAFRRSTLQAESGSGYAEISKGLSGLLAELSVQIAAEIRQG